MNKKKIINDPVYGFITLASDLIYDLVSHPYFQRLRYIKQLGMTHLVYPGALHTRFQHALGAMHLMGLALEVLKSKGNEISPEEEEGALIAILLHDIGHGPFSHALEHSLVSEISHETISDYLMQDLNQHFQQKLTLALQIFNNQYPKKYLHQLVSSQLDVDRMDYLNRDSFFTGVTEGMIGSDRIIKMFDVFDDQLVVEEKGIYSIEKFLIARRLMYWQVYLHKTVVSAEFLLVQILKRAKYLALNGENLFASPALQFFLHQTFSASNFFKHKDSIKHFTFLDDQDVFGALKVWTLHPDFVLSYLCKMLVNRNLSRVLISNEMPEAVFIEEKKAAIIEKLKIAAEDLHYFVSIQTLENKTYDTGKGNIQILTRKKEIIDISAASDHTYVEALIKTVRKYALSFVKV